MNRSSFLKKLGLGLGVAMVAPQVLADQRRNEIKSGVWYPKSSKELTPEDIAKQWRQSGILPCDTAYFLRITSPIKPSFMGYTIYFTADYKLCSGDMIFIPNRFAKSEKNILDCTAFQITRVDGCKYEALPLHICGQVIEEVPCGTILSIARG